MANIYIGTILLEKNRWARGKQPTYQVSEWIERFQAVGFDGMELWENHALLATDGERALLKAAKFPIAVYNTYTEFSSDEAATIDQATAQVEFFQTGGVKFNLGRSAEKRQKYLAITASWQQVLPVGTRLLCECHAGTIMENPQTAQEVFAAWEHPNFQAIIHPFDRNLQTLQNWFRHLGPRITHAHVQLRTASGAVQCLWREPALVKEALHIMHEEGFSGTYTLEFTEGTSSPGENMPDLFQAACHDLSFLRECLA